MPSSGWKISALMWRSKGGEGMATVADPELPSLGCLPALLLQGAQWNAMECDGRGGWSGGGWGRLRLRKGRPAAVSECMDGERERASARVRSSTPCLLERRAVAGRRKELLAIGSSSKPKERASEHGLPWLAPSLSLSLPCSLQSPAAWRSSATTARWRWTSTQRATPDMYTGTKMPALLAPYLCPWSFPAFCLARPRKEMANGSVLLDHGRLL